MDGYLLFAGSDGTRLFDADAGLAKLAGAVAHQVDWAGTLTALAEAGVSDILDLGPGTAMAAMARDTGLFDRTHAADDFRSAAGLRRWLTRGAGPP